MSNPGHIHAVLPDTLGASGESLDILALGDSWFWHPLQRNLVDSLHGLLPLTTLMLGEIGRNVADYVDERGSDWNNYVAYLKTYPSIRLVFLSGGGNDFAGEEDLAPVLGNRCSAATTVEECLNPPGMDALFERCQQAMRTLVQQATASNPRLTVLLHNYDYPWPGDHLRHGLGWLKKPMDTAGIPPNLRHEVIKRLIDTYGDRLQQLADADPQRVVFVRTAGTLERGDWDDDMHPKTVGFEKLARRLYAELQRRQLF
ncbi:SGNH/GDSL hydrolase family protein [Plasticicumulans acidivorans]|uniref:GDSL-like lipase/acylhydrolase family protein n=1 Tax=Plasticicumulans acidivorans TaxID=886464 RepID=A0A317MYQ2_9GAMM|nr:GDSL-type esterase/lipase family protein [Plasticicumulans acidivorans]PWV64819.1 GDSL-like lipase/acylhydrolase family protein [Plasticicumulans acidivorans]